MPLICVTRNYTINTLCWCCHLFFSHWSAALMIKGRLLEVKAISYSIPITDDPEFKSSSRDCTHLLYRSYQMWPLRYCGGFSDINMAVPPDICVTSFVTGDLLPPPPPTDTLTQIYVLHGQGCVDYANLKISIVTLKLQRNVSLFCLSFCHWRLVMIIKISSFIHKKLQLSKSKESIWKRRSYSFWVLALFNIAICSSSDGSDLGSVSTSSLINWALRV